MSKLLPCLAALLGVAALLSTGVAAAQSQHGTVVRITRLGPPRGAVSLALFEPAAARGPCSEPVRCDPGAPGMLGVTPPLRLRSESTALAVATGLAEALREVLPAGGTTVETVAGRSDAEALLVVSALDRVLRPCLLTSETLEGNTAGPTPAAAGAGHGRGRLGLPLAAACPREHNGLRFEHDVAHFAARPTGAAPTGLMLRGIASAPAPGFCADVVDGSRSYAPSDRLPKRFGGPALQAPELPCAQRLTVFYPTAEHTRPAAGWPVLMYSPAGLFVEARASSFEQVAPLTQLVAGSTGPHPALLCDMLDQGWAVVTVGSVGIDSRDFQTGCRNCDPNLFYGYDSAEWRDLRRFWGEKDFAWARQYLARFASAPDTNRFDFPDGGAWPALGIDNARVFVLGRSSGAIYAASVALGPDRRRADLPEDVFADPGRSQLLKSTACAGFIGLNAPSWFPAYLDCCPATHYPRGANGDTMAGTVGAVGASALGAASISRWVREPASHAITTPVFLAVSEPLATLDFSRTGLAAPIDPAGPGAPDPELLDPSFTAALPWSVVDPLDCDGVSTLPTPCPTAGEPGTPCKDGGQLTVHSAWHGVTLMEDLALTRLGLPPTDANVLYVANPVDLCGLETQDSAAILGTKLGDYVTGRYPGGGVLNGEIQTLARNWLLQRISSPVAAAVGVENGDDCNPLCFTAQSPAFLGLPWITTVDVAGFAGADQTRLNASFGFAATACSPVGQILFDPAQLSFLETVALAAGETTTTHVMEVPLDVTLAGRPAWAQPLVLQGETALQWCNALELTLGY